MMFLFYLKVRICTVLLLRCLKDKSHFCPMVKIPSYLEWEFCISLDTSFREHLSAAVHGFFDVSLGCHLVVVKLDTEQRCAKYN